MQGFNKVRGWLTKLSALSTLIMEVETELDELSVRRHFAIVENNNRERLKLEGEINRRSASMEAMTIAVTEWTGCTDVDQINQLLIDVRVRMTKALELYESWRQYLGYLELATLIGKLPEGRSEEDLVTHGQILELEFEMQMALVRKLLPLQDLAL